MSPLDAAKLLDLPADATPEQLEARFLELRAKLEDKIAKAPTPGLKAKYRESLEQITTAFETLTLAADSSALPVLQKHAAEGQASTAATASATAPATTVSPPARPAARKKSGGKEFVLVALIAVVLLGGGAWFVVQQRAERAAAAAAALQQKQEEEARAAAQARKIAELRTELATAKVAWEALENRLRDAERRTSEAKSEIRSFRDGSAAKKAELSAMAQRHEMFSSWLNTLLATHPAKIARARADQLLSDRLVVEAEEAVVEMREHMEFLQQQIPERASAMLDGTATVSVVSKPTGLKFVFTDAYGRQVEGVTPAKLTGQPLSDLHDPKYDGDAGDTEIPVGEFRTTPSVRFFRPGWPDIVKTDRTTLDGAQFSAEFAEGKLQINAQPAGAPFVATNALGWRSTGTTPATLPIVPPGKVTVTLTRPGFREVSTTTDVVAGKNATVSLDQRAQSVQLAVAEAKSKIFVNGKFAGYEKATVNDLPPGEHNLQIEAAGYRPFRTKFTVKQEASVLSQSYSFKQLATENITCNNCKGSGSFQRSARCDACNGRGRITCPWCEGRGGRNTIDIMTRQVNGWVNCEQCRGSRVETCGSCDRGTRRWTEYCNTCGGDGRVSQLQLSP